MHPLLLAAEIALLAAPALALTAQQLRGVEDRWTLRLTTIGRRSHQPRTVTIWFVRDEGRICVQAGREGKQHWYRNLLENPEVTVDLGALMLRGHARAIDDPAEVERVHALFRAKYLLSRISGWLGLPFGRGKVVVVEGLEEARPAPPDAAAGMP